MQAPRPLAFPSLAHAASPATEACHQEGRLDAEAALRAELIAVVDHDLRTALTTVLGALQTMARPELAPADPDLAGLLSSALAQAQKMRRLLDELVAATSPAAARPLLPDEIARLIREAAGSAWPVAVDVPADLPPVALSGPGLRRVLSGALSRVRHRESARVAVTCLEGDCRVTCTAAGIDHRRLPAPAARLVAAMGGRLEPGVDPSSTVLCLVFPGACRPAG